MQAGATLGRRFTVSSTVEHDLPGVERWIAHDERRAVEVYVDVVVAATPNAVRQAAVRAAQVRDARFARVLASGRETIAGERVTYIVTELPQGMPLSALAGQRIVPFHEAASLIGEAARALMVASTQGVHHGYLRASCLTVTPAGRVVVSGVNADGELAEQADLGDGRAENTDAAALGELFLTLLTGKEASDVTVADVPVSLTPAAANLARIVVAGTGPTTLAQVADALGPADMDLLRSVRDSAAGWPSVRRAHPERHAVVPVNLEAQTLAAAEREAAASVAAGIGVAHLTPEQTQAHLTAALTPSPPPNATADAPETGEVRTPRDPLAQYATPEEAARFSARTRRAVVKSQHQPLALDTFETFNERQNSGPDRSLWQAFLEFVQRHVPQNEPLDAAVDHARKRAAKSGPLNSGPLIVALVLTGLVILGAMAFSSLTAPYVPEDGIAPDRAPGYPEFTLSPSPAPSPEGDGG
ncbi:hypothetical protein [Demequina sp.]|uniref:hypothetical protein n=1 Tax=Demequina sp. TaxID=2050685 RepID=UPI003A847D54